MIDPQRLFPSTIISLFVSGMPGHSILSTCHIVYREKIIENETREKNYHHIICDTCSGGKYNMLYTFTLLIIY